MVSLYGPTPIKPNQCDIVQQFSGFKMQAANFKANKVEGDASCKSLNSILPVKGRQLWGLLEYSASLRVFILCLLSQKYHPTT